MFAVMMNAIERLCSAPVTALLILFGTLATSACDAVQVPTTAKSNGVKVPPPVHAPVVIDNPKALAEAKFSLKMGDIVVPYDVFSLFVLPKQTTEFEILYPQANTGYTLFVDGKALDSKQKNQWHWTAGSQPGMHRIAVKTHDNQTGISINVFVMVPAEKMREGRLKYYHIGPYPDESEINNKAMYVEPEGFIEVTPENQHTRLSPHFTLKEFLSKQRADFPKFVYLQSPLLLKLEKLRREMNIQNIRVDNMVVLSGYRTPQYNRAIGNVKFSRHVYGDAADIFVDNDGDYRMDDLNNDGKQDIRDAEVMARVVESLTKRSSFKGLIGGLGVYGPKPHRGAFIHIDTRGVKARWRKP